MSIPGRAARVGTFFFALLIAGCGTKPAPPAEPPQAAPAQASAAAPVAPSVPPASPAPSAPPPSAQTPAVAAQPPIAAVEPARPPTAPPTPPSTDQTQAKSAPATKAAPKAPSAPAPAAQPPKPATSPSEAAKPQAPPPLDLTSLETRLKETNAIGVLTKLSLKNQVDDLLNQFRAYYQGRLKTTLAELRRTYDLLVLKVLSLLQDSDPSLAAAIVASREAIWGILSDPAKFANFASL